jgi:hypothetical protein
MGDGPIEIILVPGPFTHIEFLHELPGYTAFLRRLSSFARVVAFDKRGQGAVGSNIRRPPTVQPSAVLQTKPWIRSEASGAAQENRFQYYVTYSGPVITPLAVAARPASVGYVTYASMQFC